MPTYFICFLLSNLILCLEMAIIPAEHVLVQLLSLHAPVLVSALDYGLKQEAPHLFL